MNRTKFVGESHFFQIFSFFFRSGNRDMNLMLFKETAGIVQPLRRVVVSRDEKHRNPGRDVGKLREELIQHRIGLPGGNRAVKNIPRNQNRIRMILFCPLRDLMQNRPLIGKQTVGIELFTDMKIRNMKKTHAFPPFNRLFFHRYSWKRPSTPGKARRKRRLRPRAPPRRTRSSRPRNFLP